MNNDSTQHLEPRIQRAFQTLPLDPGPFREEWLSATPRTVVPVLPARNRMPAYLSAAALLVIAIGALFFYQQQKGANGADGPAIVLFRKGSISVTRDGKQISLTAGFRLSRGDSITVPADGRLDLHMPDGSTARILGEADIRLLSLNKKIAIEQKKGTTYHSVVPSVDRREYNVHTPTAIASVRGTQFAVENPQGDTVIRVSDGKVEARLPDSETAVVLESGEEAQMEPASKILEKKRANTTTDIVVFEEIEKQRTLWSPEVLKQLDAMETTADEGQIEKIYSRPLEILYMTDGRILKGVVASQVDRTLILHTTEGVIAIPIEELQEVRFQKE